MPARLLLWTTFTASFLFLMAITVFAQTTLPSASCDVPGDGGIYGRITVE